MVLLSMSALEKPMIEKITFAAIRKIVMGVSEKFMQLVLFKTKELMVCSHTRKQLLTFILPYIGTFFENYNT